MTVAIAYQKLHADISTALQNNPGANPLVIARLIGATPPDLTVWKTQKPNLPAESHRCVHSLMIFVSCMPSVAKKYGIQQTVLPPSREALLARGFAADELQAVASLMCG